MLFLSWAVWLRRWHRLGLPLISRSMQRGRRTHLEDLESRLLLTANLPVAVDDLAIVNEDQVLFFSSVLVNDFDVDGDNVDAAFIDTNPAHGTLTLNADGTFVFTPDADFHGLDFFTYFAKDSAHDETSLLPAKVTINVQSINDIPVANSNSLQLDKNLTFHGILTASDADQDPLTFQLGTVAAAHGTVSVAQDGTFSYTPTFGFTGSDSFSFTASDGTATSSEATVNITVANQAPTLNSSSGVTDEDSSFMGAASPLGLDADGDPLNYSIVSPPAHGTVSLSADGNFIYTPKPNFNGRDSFTIKATDGTSSSDPATILLIVNPVDDPFQLVKTTAPTVVARDYNQIPIDSSAKVGDLDTPLDYSNTTITARIATGGNRRDVLSIRNQGTGPGLVKLHGQAIYYGGGLKSIGHFSGGYDKPLQIAFNSNASEAAVNAVLKRIGFKTSKKGGTGDREILITVNVADQSVQGLFDVDVQ